MSRRVPHEMTILVVDDDPFQRKVLRAWLAADGWRVEEASDGDQAVERADGVRMVLLDLRLGEEDGCEVGRRIVERSGGGGPQLVAMSADMSPAVRARCRDAGFVHTLAKPFQQEGLLETLRTLRGRSAAPRGDQAATAASAPDEVPESLREVPALAALWRLEQASSEPELRPAVEGLRQAGQILTSSAEGDGPATDQAVAAAAHGLAGAAGVLGCLRVEATSKALAGHARRRGVDGEARLLLSVIENELERAVDSLLAKIDEASG